MTRKEFLSKLEAAKERKQTECSSEFYCGFSAALRVVESLLPEKFYKDPGKFEWGKVEKGMIVKHMNYGYGVVVSVRIERMPNYNGASAQIQFECGGTATFYDDAHKDFEKIGPWMGIDLK